MVQLRNSDVVFSNAEIIFYYQLNNHNEGSHYVMVADNPVKNDCVTEQEYKPADTVSEEREMIRYQDVLPHTIQVIASGDLVQ
ncbi:hypothetical protein PROVRUST_07399 [Providencia rustigianii DSM 4541]|uniref:Uncharacterized protein n=1 Tax=Providencia rustigianii DSM 4541 TaxID=500637 RepID=D1P594_9GAMM|nr:hypothetical protein PROVRUST_07399 [Providencia rustigianii DSM 4541]